MKRFGLIGNGIALSKSPALFEAAYGGKYAYDLLEGTDFKKLADKFLNGYEAVNVTAPFKEDAMRLADEVSDAAALCGAANMLMKTPKGGIIADNSDFEGVTLSIMSAYAVAGVDVDDEEEFAGFLSEKTALVIGCGGAGKAAAAALVTLGAGRTVLWNRTVQRAVSLKHHIEEFYDDLAPDEIAVAPTDSLVEEFSRADIVIYTPPVSLGSDLNRALHGLNGKRDKLVLEANCTSPCMGDADGKYTYVSGLNWLYNQAVVAYEAFTGIEPDGEAMKKTLGVQNLLAKNI